MRCGPQNRAIAPSGYWCTRTRARTKCGRSRDGGICSVRPFQRTVLSLPTWREIVETLKERPFQEVGGNWMRTHGTAHAGRYHEMVQVEVLLRDLGLELLLTGATTAFFERSTQLALVETFHTAPKIPEEVVAALDHLLCQTQSMSQSNRRKPFGCAPTP